MCLLPRLSDKTGRARISVATLAGADLQGHAMAALDRIVIPQDALDRFGGLAPRSSLIVTDEALSRKPERERNSRGF